MKLSRRIISVLFTPIIIIMLTTTTALAWDKQVNKVKSATDVMNEIRRIPEKGIPPKLLKDAQAIAVIPSVLKLGFIFAIRYGQGVVSVRKSDGSWSNPSFISLVGGSAGFQAGAQSTDIILVFKNKERAYNMRRGKLTLGVDASVAVGPVGRHAEAATDTQLKAQVYSYSRSRGLFAGIALEGASIMIDHKSNEIFYETKDVSTMDIFKDDGISTPKAAEKFKNSLSN
ncbi:MAG: lipid-binding SYLF domain-containing protein [Thermodesulfobacteriota bacterium]